MLEYASPVWGSIISDSNFNKLQTVQNAALRTATGCHQMAPIQHLHVESKTIPVKSHIEMKNAQFLIECQDNDHTSYTITRPKFQDRPNRKQTLQEKYGNRITNFDFLDTKRGRKLANNKIHTDTVKMELEKNQERIRLNGWPPLGTDLNINQEELTLPRLARCRLSQLRSGYCSQLNSYRNRIDPTIENKCPDCKKTPHDVPHLFKCKKNPTTLTTSDLWRQPAKVAKWLNLVKS